MTSQSHSEIILAPGDIYGPVPRGTPKQPKPPRRLRRIFEALLWIIVIVHLYALVLRVIPVPGTILMMQRAGAGETIRKDWTRLEDISPHLPRAVMGGEDSKFCEHLGIDFTAIGQALQDNAEGGRRRGGSTITQQTSKNVFLWNGGGYVRKAAEAWLALYTNVVWGKRRTMEIYLNVAEWGDGIFGAEAAAQARFGKSAKELTAREAALLAAVLPSPNKWKVSPTGPYVNGSAITLMKRAEVIRTSQYDSCLKLKE